MLLVGLDELDDIGLSRDATLDTERRLKCLVRRADKEARTVKARRDDGRGDGAGVGRLGVLGLFKQLDRLLEGREPSTSDVDLCSVGGKA